jgi:hypothetical protein
MVDKKYGIIVKAAEEVRYEAGQITGTIRRLTEHDLDEIGNELGISDVVDSHVRDHPPYNELWKVAGEGGVNHYYLVKAEPADEKLRIGGDTGVIDNIKTLVRGFHADNR